MIDKLKRAYRRGGMRIVMALIFERMFPVPNPIFYWSTFVMLKVTEATKALPRKTFRGTPRYQVKVACAEDKQELLEQYPQLASLTESRIRDPHKPACLIVKCNQSGKIVGFGWLKFVHDYRTNSGYVARFDGGKPAWGYGLYIHSDYRNSPVLLLLARSIEQYATERKCTGIFAETHIFNVPAIRAFAHLGMHVYETVTFISLAGLKIYRIRDHERQRTRLSVCWTYDTHQILSVEGV